MSRSRKRRPCRRRKRAFFRRPGGRKSNYLRRMGVYR